MRREPRSQRRRFVVLALTGSLLAALLGTGVVDVRGSGAPAAAAAAAATCLPAGGVGTPEAAAPQAEVVFRGHGFGHAVGMSQYGAQGAARLGCTYPTILRTYYAGASVVAKPMSAEVRLWLLRGGRHSDAVLESGAAHWVFCTPSCAVVRSQPAGAWYRVVVASGRLRLVQGTTVLWTAPGSGTLVHRHSGSVVKVTTSGGTFATSRRLRWDETRYTAPTASTLQAVQAIRATTAGTAMDKYLAGLGEVPVTWPVEALKAQVVAARTYAARKLAVAGAVLYPSVKDQHYVGYPKEVEDAAYGSRWRSAVTATSGRVLVDSRGAMISAMYSSSSGGYTEDARYVFGSAGAPYLLDVDDSRWLAASSDGNRSWAAGFTRAQAAARLGFGSVESITVAPRGSDARWQDKVVVTGVRAGVRTTREIAGNTVRSAFGLKSPGFRIRLAVGGSGATPIAGDWDGDGRTDLGWFRNGAVALRWRDGSLRTFSFGQAGDVPVVGDWDGNGTDTIGVFRAGMWYLRNAHSTGAASYPAFRYGQAGDRPVAGDWAGVGRAGLGVARGTTWYLRRTATSGVGAVKFGYGAVGDVPLLGDWDGNGTATVGVRRGATWYVRNTVATWTPSTGFGYGVATDRPVVGDWDDDGDSGPGVVRGTTWYLRNAVSAGAAGATVAFAG